MLSYFLLILQSASRSDGSGTVISHVFDYAHFHHVKSFNKKYCICHFYLFFNVFLSVAVLGQLPDSFIKTEISFVYSLFPKITFICRCWLCLSVVGVRKQETGKGYDMQPAGRNSESCRHSMGYVLFSYFILIANTCKYLNVVGLTLVKGLRQLETIYLCMDGWMRCFSN